MPHCDCPGLVLPPWLAVFGLSVRSGEITGRLILIRCVHCHVCLKRGTRLAEGNERNGIDGFGK